MTMQIILDQEVREGALRADRAWELLFDSKSSMTRELGKHMFANWLWDELGERAGNLNRNAKGEVTVTIPPLDSDARDFLLRLLSFWANEVYVRKEGTMSDNLWKKPVVNVFDDEMIDGAERSMKHDMDDAGSYERNLMPLLGPGREYFSVQVIEKGERTARLHSHSDVDEYYLILEGKGTLRFNGIEVEVKRGDLVGKPTGPDAATHLLADRGEKLRILDMEIWRERAVFTKDVIGYPENKQLLMRGTGWGAIIPLDSLTPSEK
jgi:uncharacterized cupin superfamily protein